jgi:hypothetical protein
MLFVESPGLFFSLPPRTLQVSYGISHVGDIPYPTCIWLQEIPSEFWKHVNVPLLKGKSPWVTDIPKMQGSGLRS